MHTHCCILEDSRFFLSLLYCQPGRSWLLGAGREGGGGAMPSKSPSKPADRTAGSAALLEQRAWCPLNADLAAAGNASGKCTGWLGLWQASKSWPSFDCRIAAGRGASLPAPWRLDLDAGSAVRQFGCCDASGGGEEPSSQGPGLAPGPLSNPQGLHLPALPGQLGGSPHTHTHTQSGCQLCTMNAWLALALLLLGALVLATPSCRQKQPAGVS